MVKKEKPTPDGSIAFPMMAPEKGLEDRIADLEKRLTLAEARLEKTVRKLNEIYGNHYCVKAVED